MALFAGGANGATGPAALQPQNAVLMTRNTGDFGCLSHSWRWLSRRLNLFPSTSPAPMTGRRFWPCRPQTLTRIWRAGGPWAKPGCAAIAADLLAAYRKARWADLTQSELHTNYWHEGQLRAGLGQTQAATRLMMAGVNPEMSRSGFSDYALGTIAFLHQDRPGLIAARERLAALPKPADFDQAAQRFKAAYGFDLEWPANLKVLDGFIACFDRPYNEAYGSRGRGRKGGGRTPLTVLEDEVAAAAPGMRLSAPPVRP